MRARVNFAANPMTAGQNRFKPSFPFNPGFEVSGVVAEAGEDVNELGPGDRVMARYRTAGTRRRYGTGGEPLAETGRPL